MDSSFLGRIFEKLHFSILLFIPSIQIFLQRLHKAIHKVIADALRIKTYLTFLIFKETELHREETCFSHSAKFKGPELHSELAFIPKVASYGEVIWF